VELNNTWRQPKLGSTLAPSVNPSDGSLWMQFTIYPTMSDNDYQDNFGVAGFDPTTGAGKGGQTVSMPGEAAVTSISFSPSGTMFVGNPFGLAIISNPGLTNNYSIVNVSCAYPAAISADGAFAVCTDGGASGSNCRVSIVNTTTQTFTVFEAMAPCGPPAIALDGTIYVIAGWPTTMYAISPSGMLHWTLVVSNQARGYACAPPVIHGNGNILAGCNDGIDERDLKRRESLE
jgi:hypothetical protein